MPKKITWEEETVQFLIKNYPKEGLEFCSKILINIPKATIMSKCSRLNLPIKRKEYKNEQRQKTALSLTNPEIPEAAYLLGFLWGDGCLYSNPKNKSSHNTACEILTTDYRDLENTIMKLNVHWAIYNTAAQYKDEKNKKSRNGKPMTRFSTNNVFLYDFLKNNDYKIKSGLTPTKILSIIPEHLKRYFHLGYSDADGCFYHNTKNVNKNQKHQMAGTYDQDWAETENLLKSLNCNYSIRRIINKKGHKSSVLTVENKISILAFGNYLYPNGFEFGLKRKHDKFKAMDLVKRINQYC